MIQKILSRYQSEIDIRRNDIRFWAKIVKEHKEDSSYPRKLYKRAKAELKFLVDTQIKQKREYRSLVSFIRHNSSYKREILILLGLRNET